MIETREKDINGSRYTVTQLTARRALRLQCKLLRIFGPSIFKLLIPNPGVDNDRMVVEDSAGKLIELPFTKEDAVQAFKLMMAQLDEKTFEPLVLELLQGVRKSGVELTDAVIDLEFAGDLATLMKVLWFVLETNYDNFFGKDGFGSIFSWKNTETMPIIPIA